MKEKRKKIFPGRMIEVPNLLDRNVSSCGLIPSFSSYGGTWPDPPSGKVLLPHQSNRFSPLQLPMFPPLSRSPRILQPSEDCTLHTHLYSNYYPPDTCIRPAPSLHGSQTASWKFPGIYPESGCLKQDLRPPCPRGTPGLLLPGNTPPPHRQCPH